ncbi:MAG: serine hydrolase [Alphaproteobacteria bacterium]|nr:serine hydrolase [Alphaproteobacteria bacterium]
MTEALSGAARKILEDYNVPGAALSILKDGKPIWRECFGVMSTASERPLNDAATFDIGSISKTFNAASVGLLVEAGELTWDTRAIDVLPEFRLSDPTITPHVLIRDLVGQSVGFGEDNIMNYNSRFTRPEIIGLIPTLPLRVPFRSECAYQQFGPIAATAIVERLTGMAWEDFVEREVRARLGLKETFASYFRMPDRSIACDPHIDLGDGGMSVIPHRNFDALSATGGMTASQRDMETWFSAFACGGAVHGRRLLNEATVEEMLTPRIAVHRNGIHPQRWASRYEANFVSYGLGWYAHDFAGRRINEHTGALEGFLVLGCSVPSERVAIVILTNQHSSASINPLRYLLLAHAFGLEQKDWDSRFRAFAKEAKRGPRMIDGEPYFWRPLAKVEGTRASQPLADYAGDYVNTGYGAVPVRVENGRMSIDVIGNPCDAEHWHRELFRAVPRDPGIRSYHPQIFFGFEPDPAGKLTRLNIPTIGRFDQAI